MNPTGAEARIGAGTLLTVVAASVIVSVASVQLVAALRGRDDTPIDRRPQEPAGRGAAVAGAESARAELPDLTSAIDVGERIHAADVDPGDLAPATIARPPQWEDPTHGPEACLAEAVIASHRARPMFVLPAADVRGVHASGEPAELSFDFLVPNTPGDAPLRGAELHLLDASARNLATIAPDEAGRLSCRVTPDVDTVLAVIFTEGVYGYEVTGAAPLRVRVVSAVVSFGVRDGNPASAALPAAVGEAVALEEESHLVWRMSIFHSRTDGPISMRMRGYEVPPVAAATLSFGEGERNLYFVNPWAANLSSAETARTALQISWPAEEVRLSMALPVRPEFAPAESAPERAQQIRLYADDLPPEGRYLAEVFGWAETSQPQTLAVAEAAIPLREQVREGGKRSPRQYEAGDNEQDPALWTTDLSRDGSGPDTWTVYARFTRLDGERNYAAPRGPYGDDESPDPRMRFGTWIQQEALERYLVDAGTGEIYKIPVAVGSLWWMMWGPWDSRDDGLPGGLSGSGRGGDEIAMAAQTGQGASSAASGAGGSTTMIDDGGLTTPPGPNVPIDDGGVVALPPSNPPIDDGGIAVPPTDGGGGGGGSTAASGRRMLPDWWAPYLGSNPFPQPSSSTSLAVAPPDCGPFYRMLQQYDFTVACPGFGGQAQCRCGSHPAPIPARFQTTLRSRLIAAYQVHPLADESVEVNITPLTHEVPCHGTALWMDLDVRVRVWRVTRVITTWLGTQIEEKMPFDLTCRVQIPVRCEPCECTQLSPGGGGSGGGSGQGTYLVVDDCENDPPASTEEGGLTMRTVTGSWAQPVVVARRG